MCTNRKNWRGGVSRRAEKTIEGVGVCRESGEEVVVAGIVVVGQKGDAAVGI